MSTTLERYALTFARVFDALPALVFKAWTDPALAARWWGPQGFTTIDCEMDIRVGGPSATACVRRRAPD